jgi:phosphatidylinositol-3-phosphatase
MRNELLMVSTSASIAFALAGCGGCTGSFSSESDAGPPDGAASAMDSGCQGSACSHGGMDAGNPDASFADAGGPDGGIASDAGMHKFDYLVVILMENHNYSDIYGTATFMTQLADQNVSLQQYTGIDHPSLPNYLSLFADLAGDCSNGGCATGGCMASGDDSTADCSPTPGTSCWMGNDVNLVDRLEAAGLTWQAWNENACGPCDYGAGNVRHVPFLYFADIVNNPTRCNHVVASTPGTDVELIAALGSTATASNFMWLTPDDNHNMHDNSVASGDAYLQSLVPQILTSTVFTTQKAALFIVFDEGSNTCPNDLLYAVWAGSAIKTAQQFNTAYSHYSFAATIEANWGLPPINGNDAAATPMMEVFR